VLDGALYVLGGQVDGRSAHASVERLDLQRGTWSAVAPMTTPRAGFAAATIGGSLYALGGMGAGGRFTLASVERFDPRAGTWSAAASMGTPRGVLAAAAFNGNIYALGGSDGRSRLATVECFDPRADAWTVAAPMGVRREAPAAATLGNSGFFVLGGSAGSPPKAIASVENFVFGRPGGAAQRHFSQGMSASVATDRVSVTEGYEFGRAGCRPYCSCWA